MKEYVVEDGVVELEVLLLDFAGCLLHVLFEFLDLFVSLVDGNGLDLFGKRQLLDALLNLLQSNASLFLSGQSSTKKSSISTTMFKLL